MSADQAAPPVKRQKHFSADTLYGLPIQKMGKCACTSDDLGRFSRPRLAFSGLAFPCLGARRRSAKPAAGTRPRAVGSCSPALREQKSAPGPEASFCRQSGAAPTPGRGEGHTAGAENTLLKIRRAGVLNSGSPLPLSSAVLRGKNASRGYAAVRGALSFLPRPVPRKTLTPAGGARGRRLDAR